MTCATCGATNPPAARFCGTCGARLGVGCPRCDATVPLGLRFCVACGAPVDGAVAVPGGGEPGLPSPALAERRRVSILFLDLEDFTSLAEALDPEEVRALQSRYFEMARSVVATYGGTIEKFIGDAVMAVWGAPLAHEDDADRAVRAALALVHAVARLGGAASRGSLAGRAAVATGEVAVTLGAVGQGMVAGDLVNTAARLQSLAPAGGVLVDDATRHLAPDAASWKPIGELDLRGRAAPVTAFRAAPREDVAASRPTSHTGPFVGRERELRELVELFEGVERDRRCRLVTVTGIAGIGKSRLVWELMQELERLPHDVAWHAGRAPAYGEEVTFAAVAEMVRRRIRIADGADPELGRRQLSALLAELVRDEAERRWIEPRVGVLLGRDGLGSFDRAELFAAWRRFFERVSDSAPAVLVFEDLQWADASLLDFIEHLATWARGHPILVLAVARPELLDRRPTWGAMTPSHTSIQLERLSDAAMRTLLLGRDPGLTDELVRRILERAGGVPLYAVEVVRILADRPGGRAGTERRAVPRPGTPRRQPAIDVPESLQGLIAARIDALPPTERRLLLAAAVLGRRFRPEALAAVAGGDAGEVRAVAANLVRRELLALDDEFASPGRGDLAFVQDLVREVAYHTVARSERRSLHLAAARYVESLSGDDAAESLAGHLLEAHRLAPAGAEAAAIGARAATALRRAARNALRLHVPERAVEHLETALRLADSPEDRATILDEAVEAARAAARLELAERHLHELVEIHTGAGRPAETALARARLASVLLMEQFNDRALAELEEALGAVEDVGRDAAGAELAAQLARARVIVGDERGAVAWSERAIEAAERLGLGVVATDALITRGTARYRLGDEAAGLADLRRAIERAEELGSLSTDLRARNNLAWLIVTDDPRETFETARVGLELATTMGVGDMAVQLGSVASDAAVDTGDWDWALATTEELAQRAIPDAYRIDLASTAAIIRALRGDPEPLATLNALGTPEDLDHQVEAGVAVARAWAALAAGSLEEAWRLASGAAAAFLGADRADGWMLAGRAALWLGDRARAGDALRQVEALGASGRAARAAQLTLDAGVAALDGLPEAGARYRHAVEAWRELDLPPHLALCLLDRARLLGEPVADEAVAALASLGATTLLPDGVLPAG